MRLKVIKSDGLTLPGGSRPFYAMGEEFDLPEDRRGTVLTNVLLARKYVRKAEPVIVGTPTQAPARRRHEMPPTPPEPKPEPEPEPQTHEAEAKTEGGGWMQPPWAEPEATEESHEGEPARGRRGRFARRDLRPEE